MMTEDVEPLHGSNPGRCFDEEFCQTPSGHPDNVCPTCREWEYTNHWDMRTIPPHG